MAGRSQCSRVCKVEASCSGGIFRSRIILDKRMAGILKEESMQGKTLTYQIFRAKSACLTSKARGAIA